MCLVRVVRYASRWLKTLLRPAQLGAGSEFPKECGKIGGGIGGTGKEKGGGTRARASPARVGLADAVAAL